MSLTAGKKWAVLVAVVLAIGVGVIGAGRYRQHAAVGRTLPPRPNVESAPAGLPDELTRLEHEARGYRHPVRALAALSRLYHANGFFDAASACYDGLRELEPREAHWPHLQANLLAGFGGLEAARVLQEHAVALDESYLPAALRLGEIQLKSNRAAAAAVTFGAVLKRDEGNRFARVGLAKCALAAGDEPAARADLQRALGDAPDFSAALALMLTLEKKAGREVEARALAARLGKREVADFPDPWVDDLAADCFDPYRLSVAAAAAISADDAVAGRRWLERAISLAPHDGAYRRQLGKLFFQSRDFPRAREQVEQAVQLSSADSDAWVLLAEIFGATGDLAAVDRALAAGLKACPQSPALHYATGHRLSEAGRFSEAIRELKTSQALRPNEVNAGIDLAMIYFRAARIENGVAELKAVLAVQPGHPLAMEILTRHAISSNDETGARRWWRELKLQPRVPPEDLKAIADEFRQQFGQAPQ